MKCSIDQPIILKQISSGNIIDQSNLCPKVLSITSGNNSYDVVSAFDYHFKAIGYKNVYNQQWFATILACSLNSVCHNALGIPAPVGCGQGVRYSSLPRLGNRHRRRYHISQYYILCCCCCCSRLLLCCCCLRLLSWLLLLASIPHLPLADLDPSQIHRTCPADLSCSLRLPNHP